MVKVFDLNQPQRWTFDDSEIQFTQSGTARQFQTAQGRNILKGTVPTTDNPAIPTATLLRLTDGNPEFPFRAKDVSEFVFTLPTGTDVSKIVVKHEPGTQPNDVIIATSIDQINLTYLFNNDKDNSQGQGIGEDPEFIASEEGLCFYLNCESAGFLHVWTAGNVSQDTDDPSSNETRISEIELYECVYTDQRPELRTKEVARLTLFNALNLGSVEGMNHFLQWRIVVGGQDYWYDGVDWVAALESWHWNTTAEVDANIASLFTTPGIFEVGFAVRFVSETGEDTAELTMLSLDFENSAAIKATTTTVFARFAKGNTGQPETDIYVTVALDISANHKSSVTAALTGSDARIVPVSSNVQPPPDGEEAESAMYKVNAQGIWRAEIIPNSIMSADRSQYTFTLWRRDPKNTKKFRQFDQIVAEIPKQNTAYDLGGQVVAMQ